jgi:type VI secretion system protein ImpH
MFRLFGKKNTKSQVKNRVKSIKHRTLNEEFMFAPERFSFVKAMDMSMALCDKRFIKIKFKINFSSKFNDISDVNGIKDGIAEIHTNMQSIAGIEGNLPDCYTEEFITFNRTSKKAVTDFFDIFNNKIASLKYSYTKKFDTCSLSVSPECSLIGNILFSLSGFEFKNDFSQSAGESSIPEQIKISCQNLFWQNTRTSSGLKTMLSSFFDIPIEIKQFSGGFLEAPQSSQTSLGVTKNKYNKLGVNCFLGNKFWDSTKGIEILVGPLNFKNYTEFLTKKSGRDQKFSRIQKMKEIIRMYVPYGLDVNVHVFLEECAVKETFLNGTNRLNKDAFITGIHLSKNVHFCEKI